MTASAPSKERMGWETSRSQLPANGLLIVCAWCKKGRDEEGDWQCMERGHVRNKHSGRTSHGICPECAYVLTRELDAAPVAKQCESRLP